MDDPFYDFRGFNPARKSYSNEPEEHLDPFTGSFTLIYTDIYLPGNGGLDLAIMRVYNSDIYRDWEQPQVEAVPVSWIGFGWSLHMGRLVFPNGWPPQDPDYAYLIMPDGSNHIFYEHPDQLLTYISKDYWLLKATATGWEVLFTDGTKWNFDALVFGSWTEAGGNPIMYYPTAEIRDPTYNNAIQISYTNTGSNEAVMTEILDACNRHIYFYMDGTDNLQRIVANENEYRFEYTDGHIADYKLLVRVKYPEDQGSYYTYRYDYRNEGAEYDGEMISRINPCGMIYNYAYAYHMFNIGGQQYVFRVLAQRQTMTGTTWNMTYVQAYTLEDSTTIDGPYHRTVYKMYGYNMTPPEDENWRIGLILSKKIGIGGVCPLYVKWTYDYEPSPPISPDRYYGPETHDNSVYVPRLIHVNIEEYSRSDGGTQYTADYDTYYDSYDNYGNCLTMREYSGYILGDDENNEERGLKSTTFQYWYSPIRNIVHDKVRHLGMSYSDASGPNHVEVYEYFDNGKLGATTIDGIGTTYRYHTSFPNTWNLKEVKDETNRFVRYSHYNYGVPDQIENGVYTISRTINWEGTVASETNGRGYTTSYQYDGQNRLRRIDPPLPKNPTIIDYAPDNTWKKTSQGNSWTQENYDYYGRLDNTENSQGVKVEYDFNTYGWLTHRSFPYTGSNEIGVNYSYDYLGRLLSRVLPGHWTETFHHYNGGYPVMVYKDQTAHQGHQMRYVYRSFGSPFGDLFLFRVIFKYQYNVLYKEARYDYNNADKISKIRWQYSEYVRDFNYYDSNIGLLQSEASPERGTTSYTYETNGNLLTRTDANGDVTTYSYDGANRLVAVDYPGSQYNVIYAYDHADNLILVQTPEVVKHYNYDAMNRITGDTLQIDGQEFRVYYDYDNNGNLWEITYPDETIVQYSYDSENRILTIPGFINTDIQYHPSGHESWYQTTNGCQTSLEFHEDRYFIKRITATPLIMDDEYGYDQSGNLTNLTDHLNINNNMSFTYDDFHRLEDFNALNLWGSGSYSYENICLGRRENENINGSITNYAYNNTTKRLDYTTGVCACDFDYDANGNICNVTGDKALAIKIDYENRPVSITNRKTGDRVDYVYDGKGERVKRSTPCKDSPYYYMTAPWGGVLYEYRSGSLEYFKYVFLNGKLLVKIDRDGNKYFYHNDYLGTPKVMTDDSQRKVYEWLGYPFGKEYASTGSYMNNYRFTGKEFDEFNDLYYYGARYYYPDFGIFISPEPFMGTNGLNLADPLSLKFYDYCRNNPLRFIDPNGLWYTEIRNGVFTIYRTSSTGAVVKTLAKNVPFISLFDCLRRKETGDIRLSQKDWAWAIADIPVSISGSTFLQVVAKAVEKFQNIAAIALYEPENIYEGYGEIIQAQYLDPVIFSRVMKKFSEYGLKETDLGNHVLLQLKNLTQGQIDEILLEIRNIGNEVGQEFYKDSPYLYYLP